MINQVAVTVLFITNRSYCLIDGQIQQHKTFRIRVGRKVCWKGTGQAAGILGIALAVAQIYQMLVSVVVG